jgi:organic radical activating enzyme
MTSVRESIRRLFTPAQPLPAGNYHYQAPQDDPRNYRLHLRIERDGSGVLILNASTVLHLNRTATEYAYHLIQDHPKEQAVRSVASRYRARQEQISQDYQDFLDRIETLIDTPDLDPVMFLGFDRQKPFTDDISAPYRLDVALTYQLPDSANPDTAPLERVSRELTTPEWQAILDKAWIAGIPHIVFTGGEPTLRPDLPELIRYAEVHGQVTGLVTDGHRLVDPAYLDELLLTGLDHLQIILDPENPVIWEAVENAIAADIFTAVHLTISSKNNEQVPGLLEQLSQLGLANISLSASSPDLSKELEEAREVSANLDLSLVWNLPVPYSAINPVNLEVESDLIPYGAGRAWLYVEPDGDVLLTKGVPRVLGNFLANSWEEIWRQ